MTWIGQTTILAVSPIPSRIHYTSSLVNVSTGIKKLQHLELECGPMPNVMVALPNIGGLSLIHI